ncbi:hypothetical protein [Embleya sp. MST-111070]|uniref:hypothetical protein n=1 Tax=Embleya sp. MST-111070 TaxID=3398231 RepID=UPI003F740EA5
MCAEFGLGGDWTNLCRLPDGVVDTCLDHFPPTPAATCTLLRLDRRGPGPALDAGFAAIAAVLDRRPDGAIEDLDSPADRSERCPPRDFVVTGGERS